MQNTERNYLLDNLKVLLIFMVVIGHVLEYYIKSNVILKSIYMYIYIFHMPLFIFISGYFSKDIDKSSNTAFEKLMIPYIVFNIIWYTGAYFVTGEVMLLLIYPGWTLWYLISLFFWRISLKYLVKVKNVLLVSFICALIIGIMPFGERILSVSRTIAYLPFFLMGYFCKESYLKKIKEMNKIISLLIMCSFAIIVFYIAKNNFVEYEFLHNVKGYINSGLSVFEGVIFRIILYLASIIFSICIINLTPKKKLFFSYVGKYTMNIYVFHIYLIIFIYALIPRWDISKLYNLIILASPIVIMVILSTKAADRAYKFIFYGVNKFIYEKVKIAFSKSH